MSTRDVAIDEHGLDKPVGHGVPRRLGICRGHKRGSEVVVQEMIVRAERAVVHAAREPDAAVRSTPGVGAPVSPGGDASS